jgi:hypothetical protein
MRCNDDNTISTHLFQLEFQKTLSYKVPYRLAMIGHQGCGHERKRDDGKAGQRKQPGTVGAKGRMFLLRKEPDASSSEPSAKIWPDAAVISRVLSTFIP